MIQGAAGQESVRLYGRVRDSSGAGVAGALVMFFAVSEKGEELLGHSFCDQQGWYLADCPHRGEGGGKYIVRATGGRAIAGQIAESGMSWPGRKGSPAGKGILVECRIINYNLLNISADDGHRRVTVESVPESLSICWADDHVFNAGMVSISGRGYIDCGEERGEGTFTLTVIGFRDTAGGELVRFRVCPDFPGASGLSYDTGGLYTGIV